MTKNRFIYDNKHNKGNYSWCLQGYIGFKGPRGDIGEPGEKVQGSTLNNNQSDICSQTLFLSRAQLDYLVLPV